MSPRSPAPCAWIEPHRYLFLYHVRPTTTWRFCPPEYVWCPTEQPQPLNRLQQLRETGAEFLAAMLTKLDPSRRFPKPKPPPLSMLAKSVGKETLVENKGRKAKIKKTRTRFIRRTMSPRRVDGWDALEDYL